MAKKIQAAGGLVRNDNNELLMIYRRGHWDLPKGKLDAGETPEICAIREVEEETGATNLKITRFIATTTHSYMEAGEAIEKETFWYTMEAKGPQQLVPQKEENITDIRWVSKASLQSYLEKTFQNIKDIIQMESQL
jgi:mutator protein MutT